ncbi:MAG: copper chaperone PCu(A)C, partial [Chloroflexota bacterium]
RTDPHAELRGSTEIAPSRQPRRTPIVDARRRDRLAPEGIPIPAEATLILEPGGDHLALVGLREDLVQGREFVVTLRFQQAGEVEVTGRVRRKIDAAGATPPPSVSAGEIDIWLVSAPPAPAYSTAK